MIVQLMNLIYIARDKSLIVLYKNKTFTIPRRFIQVYVLLKKAHQERESDFIIDNLYIL